MSAAGRAALHILGLTLWAALITTEITRQAGAPQLSTRAFAILLAAAITTTLAALLASLAVPMRTAFALGIQYGLTSATIKTPTRGWEPTLQTPTARREPLKPSAKITRCPHGAPTRKSPRLSSMRARRCS